MSSPHPFPVPSAVSPKATAVPAEEQHSKHQEITALAMHARAGVPGALGTLYARTRDDVARFIARRVDPSWVEDLTQETFTRAITGLARYTGRAPGLMWLFSVARHTVADRYRADRRRPVCESLDRLPPGREVAVVDRFDEHLALLSLVSRLPDDRRTAFSLTQIVGLPYSEAADLIGVPIGTVRSRVARSRRDLVHMLRETN